MAAIQALRGTSATVTETFSVDGAPVDVDSGVPTVVATYPDGSVITPAPVASGTWTGRTTGQYRIVLDAAAEVTVLDPITWTGTIGGKQQVLRSRVEWLGALLFNLADLRAFKVATGQPFATGAVPPFTNQQLMDARAAVLDEFESYLGFSPVPRYHREVLDGDGRGQLVLSKLKAHHPALAVSVNGVAQSVTGYTVRPSGILEATSGYGWGTPFTPGRSNVAVAYVHGWDRVEGTGSNMAMTTAAAHLDPNVFQSAVTVSTPDGGSYTYEPSEVGRSGFQRFTGIRPVDRWLNQHSARGVAVA